MLNLLYFAGQHGYPVLLGSELDVKSRGKHGYPGCLGSELDVNSTYLFFVSILSFARFLKRVLDDVNCSSVKAFNSGTILWKNALLYTIVFLSLVWIIF